MIYGVALLSACTFIGKFLGNILGLITGINKDIGGVGFAMILLLIVTNSKTICKVLPKDFSKGILFWKEMYIPIVIAMSASQNVIGAISYGWLVIIAGIATVVVSALLFMIFNRFSKNEEIKEVIKDENN